MTARAEVESGGIVDKLKMFAAMAILGGALVGYYLLPEQSQLIRVIGVVVAMIAAWLVFAQTDSGRAALEFIGSSRQELRKMHWPTRQETVQTTLAVLFMVFLLAVFMWLLDMFLLWATRGLTGQGF